MIDRKTFFDSVRDPVFNGSLGQGQVDGLECLIAMWETDYADLSGAAFAYILASCYHESAHTMQPVRETLASTDASAIRILDRAWARGQLKGVRSPYWRAGWFGRGLIQITLKNNYRRMTEWLQEKADLDVDLVKDRDLALDPDISARIAFEGMIHGLFRNGHWLGKYISDGKTDFVGARNIVNGTFRDDARVIARHADKFLSALSAARHDVRNDRSQVTQATPADVTHAQLRAMHSCIQAALEDLPDDFARQGMAAAMALHLLGHRPPDASTPQISKPEQPAAPAGFLLSRNERMTDMSDEKHALASRTIHGALTALFGMALPALAPLVGLGFTEQDGREALDAVAQIVTAAGILYAVYGRVVATRRISV